MHSLSLHLSQLAHPHSLHPPQTAHRATQSPHPQLACPLLYTRLLSKQAKEVRDLLNTLSLDLIFFTETWLNPASAPDITTAVPE